MNKPCPIDGFHHGGAEPGFRYCPWCERSINGVISAPTTPRWTPPDDTVKGLAALARARILIERPRSIVKALIS